MFARLTRALARLLQERTSEGYVLRVDLRLRPDPASTPVALSTSSAYQYYETVGQNWERAALIKARPAAGDLKLGERFLADLAPFIWRKYFDYAAIADIHAMKRQIHAVRGHEEVAVAGHDVKLGRGGIREIEFFAQTQQLIAGGRHPEELLNLLSVAAVLAALPAMRRLLPMPYLLFTAASPGHKPRSAGTPVPSRQASRPSLMISAVGEITTTGLSVVRLSAATVPRWIWRRSA